jgi:hypothetical protein
MLGATLVDDDDVVVVAGAVEDDAVVETAGAEAVEDMESDIGTVEAADLPCDTSQGFVLICDVMSFERVCVYVWLEMIKVEKENLYCLSLFFALLLFLLVASFSL